MREPVLSTYSASVFGIDSLNISDVPGVILGTWVSPVNKEEMGTASYSLGKKTDTEQTSTGIMSGSERAV